MGFVLYKNISIFFVNSAVPKIMQVPARVVAGNKASVFSIECCRFFSAAALAKSVRGIHLCRLLIFFQVFDEDLLDHV